MFKDENIRKVTMGNDELRLLASKLLDPGGKDFDFPIGNVEYHFSGGKRPTIKIHEYYAMIITDLVDNRSIVIETINSNDETVSINILKPPIFDDENYLHKPPT